MIPSVKKAKMDSGTGTPDPRTYSTNIQQARNRIRINGWTLEDERAGAPLWGLPPPSEDPKRSNKQENV